MLPSASRTARALYVVAEGPRCLRELTGHLRNSKHHISRAHRVGTIKFLRHFSAVHPSMAYADEAEEDDPTEDAISSSSGRFKNRIRQTKPGSVTPIGDNWTAEEYEQFIKLEFDNSREKKALRAFREMVSLGLKPSFNTCRVALHSCTKLRDPNSAMWILETAIRAGEATRAFLYTAAMMVVSRAGNMAQADHIVALMEQNNVPPSIEFLVEVARSVMNVSPIDFDRVGKLQDEVAKLNSSPQPKMLAVVLEGLTRGKYFDRAMELVKQIEDMNIAISHELASSMARCIASCRPFEEVEKFFTALPEQLPRMQSSSAAHGHGHRGQQSRSSVNVTAPTRIPLPRIPAIVYEFAVKGFLGSDRPTEAERVLELIPSDTADMLLVYKNFFTYFETKNDLENMDRWYKMMRSHPEQATRAGTRIVNGAGARLAASLIAADQCDKLVAYLRGPSRKRLISTVPIVFEAISQAFSLKADPAVAAQYLPQLEDVVGSVSSIQPTLALLGVYARKGLVEDAERLFDRCVENGAQPTDVMCNYVVEAALKAGDIDRATRMFDEMSDNGIRHTITTYRLFAVYYATHGPAIDKLMKIWEAATSSSSAKRQQDQMAQLVESDFKLVSYTLVGMAHAGRYHAAIEFYDSKSTSINGVWTREALNCLVMCYLRTNRTDDAIALFETLLSGNNARPIGFLVMMAHEVHPQKDIEKFREYAQGLARWTAESHPTVFAPWKYVRELVQLMMEHRFVPSLSPAHGLLPPWKRTSVLNLTPSELSAFATLLTKV